MATRKGSESGLDQTDIFSRDQVDRSGRLQARLAADELRQVTVVLKSGYECTWHQVKGEIVTLETEQFMFETTHGALVTVNIAEIAVLEIKSQRDLQ